MPKQKLQVKCPDVQECDSNISAEDFRERCCGQFYRCYYHSKRHTVTMSPLRWAKVKKLIENVEAIHQE